MTNNYYTHILILYFYEKYYTQIFALLYPKVNSYMFLEIDSSMLKGNSGTYRRLLPNNGTRRILERYPLV